jgi:DNA polymerase III delta prime subunit
LQQNLSTVGAATVFRLIVQAQFADNKLEAQELAAAHDIVQTCLRRFDARAGYGVFQSSSNPQDSAEVINFWLGDTGAFGGNSPDGDNFPLMTLAVVASSIARSTNVFDAYCAVASVVARVIISTGGINASEQAYLAKIDNGFAGYRDLIMGEHAATLLASMPSDASAASGHSSSPGAAAGVSPSSALKEALTELHNLVGVAGVKAEVGKLANFLKVRQQRIAAGMPATSQSLHFVFTGNPGTGKTTVARIVSKILYGFQVLASPTLIETDRSSLVGGFVGQTAIKTSEVIAKATNGVLFVDEAYTLAPNSSQGDQYGQEAIDTLLKRMEDLRETLVVIVAGYPRRMTDFLASNPGLESRFTRFIRFEDYSVGEMCQIFEGMCRKNSYTLTPAARGNLALLLNSAYRRRDEKFGNARFVRNVFEKTLGRHADHLASFDGEVSRQMLATIEAEHIPSESGENVRPHDLSASKWRVKCPGCSRLFTVDIRFLGSRANCKCGTKFVCPWWNPDPDSLPEGLIFTPSEREDDVLGLPIPEDQKEVDAGVAATSEMKKPTADQPAQLPAPRRQEVVAKKSEPEGWENTRFGMTVAEVLVAVGGSASSVNPTVDYGSRIMPLRIEEVEIDGQRFDVEFLFDKQSEKLDVVMMVFKGAPSAAAFSAVVSVLTKRYGDPQQPAKKLGSMQAEWKFAAVRIQAMLFEVSSVGQMLKIGWYPN